MRIQRSVVVAAFLAAACGEKHQDGASSTALTSSRSAAKIPTGALRQMPWLLGTFRGVGAEGTDQAAFYERYTLADDSTLVVESFKDSTLTGPIDSTRYEVRNDSLTTVGTARYVATSIAPDSVVFGPLVGVKNGFVWRRDNESSWTAVIIPVNPAAPRRTYRMHRLK